MHGKVAILSFYARIMVNMKWCVCVCERERERERDRERERERRLAKLPVFKSSFFACNLVVM